MNIIGPESVDLKQYIRQYLRDNLRVDIDEATEFGPIRKIVVKVELEDEVISESCYYPSCDNYL